MHPIMVTVCGLRRDVSYDFVVVEGTATGEGVPREYICITHWGGVIFPTLPYYNNSHLP